VSEGSLDAMRIGLGFVALLSMGKLQFLRPSGPLPHPVGLARHLDLGWMSGRRATTWLRYGWYAATLCYVADVRPGLAVGFLGAALLLELTYRSSFGSVNHGHHLLLVVLLAQAAASAAWNGLDRLDVESAVVGSSPGSTMAWWSMQAILAVYFTSGLTKLLATDGRWVQRSAGLLLDTWVRLDAERQLGPGRRQVAERSVGFVDWLVQHPLPARAMFAGGLLIELATPLGLLGVTARGVLGLALLALHQANDRLLGLPFPEYQLLVITFLVVPWVLS
jgi:hypothetical protein